MSNKYVITKVSIEGAGKKKQKKIVEELKNSVFSDVSKDSLSYYLAEELKNKNITILDLKISQVL